MHKPVLLDTSLLTAASVSGVDILQELRRLQCTGPVYIFSGTIRELESLAKKGTKQGLAAKLALRQVQRWSLTILEDTQSHVDDDIVAFAVSNPIVVGAQDALLRSRAKKTGAITVCVRQGTHLAFG